MSTIPTYRGWTEAELWTALSNASVLAVRWQNIGSDSANIFFSEPERNLFASLAKELLAATSKDSQVLKL